MIKLFKKIRWPWTKRIDEVEALLLWEVEIVKDTLTAKRLAKFIKVVDYYKGMSLRDERPEPISIVDLEKRIKALESKG